MDKEALEQIDSLIRNSIYGYKKEFGRIDVAYDVRVVDEILKVLKGAGYRKLPKDKPLLLSDDDGELAKLWKQAQEETKSPMCEYDATAYVMILIAQAQREAGIKHYED